MSLLGDSERGERAIKFVEGFIFKCHGKVLLNYFMGNRKSLEFN